LTTILSLDVILSLNDLWTFGFFFTFIELFGLWATISRRERKSLVDYVLLNFLLKNNGCNIMDGEWMVVKLLVINKRYFFQENSISTKCGCNSLVPIH
jgi:hypothetical protein